MNRSLMTALFSVVLAVFFVSAAHAQRIGIEENSTDTKTKRADGQGTTATSTRIIPPEEFGKYRDQKRQQSQLSQSALIEKLRSDSASMRIRFRETLRELRSDSRAMRRIIKRLRQQNRRLTRQVKRLRGSGGSTAPRRADTVDTMKGPSLRPGQTSSSGTAPATKTTDGSSAKQDTEAAGGESLPEGTKLNPNTASLSELKSISGLSDRLAERIEWYRREVRPFQNLQDLRRVPGIDRSVFDRIKEYFHKGPY